MTAKTIHRVGDKVTKMPGWFSWRHQTREAHDKAVATYLSKHGPEARRDRAAERLAADTSAS